MQTLKPPYLMVLLNKNNLIIFLCMVLFLSALSVRLDNITNIGIQTNINNIKAVDMGDDNDYDPFA